MIDQDSGVHKEKLCHRRHYYYDNATFLVYLRVSGGRGCETMNQSDVVDECLMNV